MTIHSSNAMEITAVAFLRAVFSSVLDVEEVEDALGFFDLGGTSLKAHEATMVIRQLYPEMRTVDILNFPTLAALALRLAKMERVAPPLTSQSVLIRTLDVTARVTNVVQDRWDNGRDGILIETLIGRYILDGDGRSVWGHLDGTRSVGDVCLRVANNRTLIAADLETTVLGFCDLLFALGVLELC